MPHHQKSAQRIVAHTVQNVQDGQLHPDQAARQLEAHADYCDGAGDQETAVIARAAARELAGGQVPALNLAGVELAAGPVPEYDDEAQPEKKKKSGKS